jgi:hypothetical protein
MPAGVAYTVDGRELLPAYDEIVCELCKVPGLSSPMIAGADRPLRKMYDFASPRALFSVIPVVSSTHEIIQADGLTVRSPIIAGLVMRDAAAAGIVPFCVTIGSSADEDSHLRKSGVNLEDYIHDRAASILVSLAADNLRSVVSRHPASEGLIVSRPFMPGSCGWDINPGLHDIFSALNAESIGLTLTAGGMISPVKSLAGIFLLTSGPIADPCRSCEIECGRK